MDTLDPADGGYASRKLIFAAGIALLIFIGALVGAWIPAFAALYSGMVGGLIGIAGIYLTGNVASQYVTGNHLVKMTSVKAAVGTPKPDPEEGEEPEK